MAVHRRWKRGVARCRHRSRQREGQGREAKASSWLDSQGWLSIAHIAVPGRDPTKTNLSSGKPKAHQSMRMSPAGTNLSNELSLRTHQRTVRSRCAAMWTGEYLPGSWSQCVSKFWKTRLSMNRKGRAGSPLPAALSGLPEGEPPKAGAQRSARPTVDLGMRRPSDSLAMPDGKLSRRRQYERRPVHSSLCNARFPPDNGDSSGDIPVSLGAPPRSSAASVDSSVGRTGSSAASVDSLVGRTGSSVAPRHSLE